MRTTIREDRDAEPESRQTRMQNAEPSIYCFRQNYSTRSTPAQRLLGTKEHYGSIRMMTTIRDPDALDNDEHRAVIVGGGPCCIGSCCQGGRVVLFPSTFLDNFFVVVVFCWKKNRLGRSCVEERVGISYLLWSKKWSGGIHVAMEQEVVRGYLFVPKSTPARRLGQEFLHCCVLQN